MYSGYRGKVMLEHTFCRVMFIMFFKGQKKQEAQILKTDLSPHILHFVSFIFFLQKCITYKAVRLSTHHNYSYQGHESEFSTSSLCPSCSWGTLDNPAGHLCLCHKTRRYSTRNKNSSLNSRFKKTIIIPMHIDAIKNICYLDLPIRWDNTMLPHFVL